MGGIDDKKKLLHGLTDERQVLFAHIYDLSQRAYLTGRSFFTDFLPDADRVLLQKRSDALLCEPHFFGGYDEAERTVAGFFGEYAARDFPVTVLTARTREMARLSHRDFLGSLMSLGIKREKCGDIVLSDDRCHIFVHSDIAAFVQSNFTKVKNVGISVSINEEELKIPEKSLIPIEATVASLRLDAVVSVAVGKGRAAANEYINAGRVFVDGICAQKADMHLSHGSTLTVRGVGKMLLNVGGSSKKGRTFVTLQKYN